MSLEKASIKAMMSILLPLQPPVSYCCELPSSSAKGKMRADRTFLGLTTIKISIWLRTVKTKAQKTRRSQFLEKTENYSNTSLVTFAN